MYLPQVGDIIRWVNDPPDRYYLIGNISPRTEHLPYLKENSNYYTMLDLETGKWYKDLYSDRTMYGVIKVA